MSVGVRNAWVCGSANKWCCGEYKPGQYCRSGGITTKEIKIKVWTYNIRTGARGTGFKWLTVNTKLACVVEKIFQEIYDDPERYPILEVGAQRASDQFPYHPNGASIDINPTQVRPALQPVAPAALEWTCCELWLDGRCPPLAHHLTSLPL